MVVTIIMMTITFYHVLLQDSNYEIREGLHLMLGTCCLSTKSCVKMLIHALLDNLKRYPQVKSFSIRYRFSTEFILIIEPQFEIRTIESICSQLKSVFLIH